VFKKAANYQKYNKKGKFLKKNLKPGFI